MNSSVGDSSEAGSSNNVHIITSNDIKKTAGIVVDDDARAMSFAEGTVDDKNALDDAILRAQGHDAAMPRSFSIMSALGLGFSITNSWVGYAVSVLMLISSS